MAGQNIYHVPQEILNHIISFVQDETTLGACALTHPSWTFASQQLLHAERLYALSCLGAVFGQLTELNLSHIAWQHSEAFTFFLSTFPRITSLRLCNCSLCPERIRDFERFPLQTVEAIPGSELRSLTVIWDSKTSGLDLLGLVDLWLSHFPQIIKKGLQFEWRSKAGFMALPHHVRAMGSVLTQLNVSLKAGDNSCSDFGLETCAQLQNIVFNHLCQPMDYRANNNGNYHWVSRMLSQVRSSYVESVRFNLRSRELADLHTLNLKFIDTVLNQTRFAQTTLTLSLTTSTKCYRSSRRHGGFQEDPIRDLDLDNFASVIQNEMENLWAQARIVLVAA
ncbi:uncharacterized protein PHACADRAFT_185797 [Phanerochaete carnosa HHB-10118-sp]|uniref:F-box domain-containing protein n=1 Tax=Phanerochaete carnosa (strain HHB-10118-sp) TaxID=650164 RepID=K5WRI0_PHACS|nr:uncharacterized protein PHACADRAFT_185797 [Phanerochaete carnosa HHB-10118-sp]EKM52987.1 hypothetical protein PHACADRAFT_185797 [Phanerochaete carnosa HHB-10118-sp]